MTGSIRFIWRSGSPRPSGKRRAGLTPGANSMSWPTSRRTPDGKRRARRKSRFLRSPWRWCAAWTRCSRSSARSTASALRNVRLFAKSQAALWSTICSSTCASRRQNFRADTISSRRSTTCSSAGPPSRYSSTTDASASRTTRRSVGCAASQRPSHSAPLLQVSVNMGIWFCGSR